MEHTANKKKSLPLWLWLCYGLLLLLAFTGSSLAGYKTTASGSDSARVAGFRYDAVTSATPASSHTIAPGETCSIPIRIYNHNRRTGQVSEVALTYDILVSRAGQTAPWLPAGLTMAVNNVGGFVWDDVAQAYRKTTTSFFAPGTANFHVRTLSFTADSGMSPVTLDGLTVSVVFRQMD